MGESGRQVFAGTEGLGPADRQRPHRLPSGSNPRTSGLRNLQILTDLARQEFLDLPMPRHGGHFALRVVYEHRVAAALAQEATAVRFQVAN